MLSKAKHLVFSRRYKDEILRLRLRMTSARFRALRHCRTGRKEVGANAIVVIETMLRARDHLEYMGLTFQITFQEYEL
jgi:uncharacterized protein YbjQ (UPF0145 family)